MLAISHFSKLPKSGMLYLCEFLQKPTEIVTVVRLWAENHVNSERRVKKEIENPKLWKRYFKINFSDDVSVFNNPMIADRKICKQVCKLAFKIYGFPSPYSLINPALSFNTPTPSDRPQKIYLNKAILCGYEKAAYQLAQRIKSDNNDIQWIEKSNILFDLSPSSAASFKNGRERIFPALFKLWLPDVLLEDRDHNPLSKYALWCVHIKDKESLALTLKTIKDQNLDFDPFQALALCIEQDSRVYFDEIIESLEGIKKEDYNFLMWDVVKFQAKEIANAWIQSSAIDIFNALVDTKETYLHYAAEYDSVDIADLLLRKRSRLIYHRSSSQETPLDTAARWNSPKIINVLLKALRCDANYLEHVQKAKDIATEFGSKDVNALLKQAIDKYEHATHKRARAPAGENVPKIENPTKKRRQ